MQILALWIPNISNILFAEMIFINILYMTKWISVFSTVYQ